MGRTMRKKQSCALFQDNSDAVYVELNVCLPWPAGVRMEGLLKQLNTCDSMKDQIKTIQAAKGTIKVDIFGAMHSNDFNLVDSELGLLICYYLEPTVLPIRKSLDWLIEILVKYISIDKKKCQLVVSRACNMIIKNQPVSLAVGTAIEWAFVFNCMAMLDKEVQWLDNSNMSHITEDSCQLLLFLDSNNRLLAHCGKAMLSDDNTNSTSAPELLRYAECYGESMRAVMNVLRPRRSLQLAAEAPRFRALISDMIQSGVQVLQSELVHRDVVTAAAMSVICLLRLLSKNESNVLESANVLATVGQLNCGGPEMTGGISRQDQAILLQDIKVYSSLSQSGALWCCLWSVLADLPLISKCACLRALMSLCEDETLLTECSALIQQKTWARSVLSGYALGGSAGESGGTCLLLGPLYSGTLTMCSHSLPNVRLYGLQVLECWFNRILDIHASANATIQGSMIANKACIQAQLLAVSGLLMSSWSHPSKQVSHMVPTVYQQLIHVLDVLGISECWAALAQAAIGLPAEHRGRYQALHQLLPKVGASGLIASHPAVLDTLVAAVSLRDIASASCALTVALVRALAVEQSSDDMSSSVTGPGNIQGPSPTPEALAAVRHVWLATVVSAVCSLDLRTRTHAADYLVPELLQLDALSGPAMISMIHSSPVSFNQKLWGLVNICMQCRLKSLPGRELVQRDDHSEQEQGRVRACEVECGCLSEDDDVRLVSLTLLTACQQTSTVLDTVEYEILQKTFQHCLKSPLADHRQRVARVVTALMTRINESTRIAVRDSSKADKRIIALRQEVQLAAGKEEVTQDLTTKLENLELGIKVAHSNLAMATRVCQWLSQSLLDHLYPGTSYDKEVMALELLHAVLDVLGKDSVHVHMFCSDVMAKTILNLMVSSRDKTRNLSVDLLMKFPQPLPALCGRAEVEAVLSWGVRLSGSPRQRESDAGAHVIKAMTAIYCLHLGWELRVNAASMSASSPKHCDEKAGAGAGALPVSKTVAATRASNLMSQLCDVLELRLQALETLFNISMHRDVSEDDSSGSGSNGAVATPLCHGLLLALQHCIHLLTDRKLLETSGEAVGSPAQFWQPLLERLLKITLSCLAAAMTVVAESPSDVQFAPVPTGSCDFVSLQSADEIASSKGPVSTAAVSTMSATYMNTNSVMIGSTDSEAVVDDKGSSMQRAVVAAWLLVKESVATLALLVSISPPTSPLDTCITHKTQILTFNNIAHVGNVILDSLGRLKHMGAISEAQFALQSIAQTLLRHGERSAELCRLPTAWLSQVLAKLDGEQQVFILRRSAGFAYSFLSLLRAEPANCQPTLLHTAMRSLLSTVTAGLRDGRESTDDDEPRDSATGSWRMAVHALNVIRLILLDAFLGPDLDIYIATCVELIVQGFKSPKWAVRNSSMMVFAAVVQRVVDNDKNHAGSARAVTVEEFLQRFPTLFPFLLKELADITGFAVSYDKGVPVAVHKISSNPPSKRGIDGSAKQRDEAATCNNLSLHPMLLLFSKMRATLCSSTTGINAVNISLFVPLVESCRDQSLYLVRTVSARAMSSLVPLDQASVRVSAMMRALVAFSSGACNDTHGALLQILEILARLQRHLQGFGDNLVFFEAIRQHMTSVLLPVSAELLSVLSCTRCASLHDVLIKIFKSIHYLVSGEVSLALLMGECIVAARFVLTQASCGSSAVVEPFQQMVFKNALEIMARSSCLCDHEQHDSQGAQELCACVVQQPFSAPPLELLLPLLQHEMSEVREGVLLGCLSAVAVEDRTQWTVNRLVGCGLVSILFERVTGAEREPPVLKLALELLCSTAQALCMGGWDHLIQLASAPRARGQAQTGTQLAQNDSSAYVLEILGWMVRHLISPHGAGDESTATRRVAQWMTCLEAAGDENQFCALREAVAQSLTLSGYLTNILFMEIISSARMLLTGQSSASQLTCRAWLLAADLLQDDDEDVRLAANKLISKSCTAVTRARGADASAAAANTALSELADPGGFSTVISHTLSSMVQPLSLAIAWSLCCCAGRVEREKEVVAEEMAGWRLVVEKILKFAGSTQDMAFVFTAQDNQLSQKIFEAELSNLNIEVTVAAQLLIDSLAVSLTLLSGCISTSALSGVLQGVTEQVANVTAGILGTLTTEPVSINWVGHATFQPDVFKHTAILLRLNRALDANSHVPHSNQIAQFHPSVQLLIER